MIIFIMENAVKHFKKLKLMAEALDTCGQFVAIFKYWSGQFWPISADTLANFSFSYLVTLLKNWQKQEGGRKGVTE